jgi:hypothetical protein
LQKIALSLGLLFVCRRVCQSVCRVFLSFPWKPSKNLSYLQLLHLHHHHHQRCQQHTTAKCTLQDNGTWLLTQLAPPLILKIFSRLLLK